MIKFLPGLFLLSILAAAPGSAPAAGALAGLREVNDGLISVFEKVAPNVVVITVEREAEQGEKDPMDAFPFDFFRKRPDPNPDPNPNPSHPDDPQQSEGSGFIVRKDGYIFTNSHVVEDGKNIKVKLKDGRSFDAKLIGTDSKTDVAVIKIEAADLPEAELADSDKVRVGQIACAIGAPYNLDYSFTVGVVSATGRSNLQPMMYEEYIQTDASINPGNSGGPLFDIDGRVIGMNTLINGLNRGLGFAIPSNMLKDIGYQLIEKGKITRPWLGIGIETFGEDKKLKDLFKGVTSGVLVTSIEAGAPAYESELRPADVISAVDGVAVNTARELQKQVLKRKIGEKLRLTVQRGGRTMDVDVHTGEMKDNPTIARIPPGLPPNLLPPEEPSAPDEGPQAPEAPVSPKPPVKDAGLGVKVQTLTPELKAQFGTTSDKGVVVTEVLEDTPAQLAGLEQGDVVTEVDSVPVENSDAFKNQLEKADPAKGVLLFVERKGEKTYAVLKAKK